MIANLTLAPPHPPSLRSGTFSRRGRRKVAVWRAKVQMTCAPTPMRMAQILRHSSNKTTNIANAGSAGIEPCIAGLNTDLPPRPNVRVDPAHAPTVVAEPAPGIGRRASVLIVLQRGWNRGVKPHAPIFRFASLLHLGSGPAPAAAWRRAVMAREPLPRCGAGSGNRLREPGTSCAARAPRPSAGRRGQRRAADFAGAAAAGDPGARFCPGHPGLS
jgi:hypothetical protein